MHARAGTRAIRRKITRGFAVPAEHMELSLLRCDLTNLRISTHDCGCRMKEVGREL